MVILRVMTFAIFLVVSFKSYAKKISTFNVTCDIKSLCSEYKDKFDDIIGLEFSNELLREQLRFKLLDQSINTFAYEVYEGEKEIVVEVELGIKRKVNDIVFTFDEDVALDEISSRVSLKIDDYYSEELLAKSYDDAKKYLREHGYFNSKVKMKVNETGSVVNISFDVTLGKYSKITSINVDSNIVWLKNFVSTKLISRKNKIWDKSSFQIQLEGIQDELFLLGFYEIKLSLKPPKFDQEDNVSLNIDVIPGKRYAFDFYHNKIFSKQEFVTEIRAIVKSQGFKFNSSDLKEVILEMYGKRGLYNTTVLFNERRGLDINGLPYIHYFVELKEGNKVKVNNLVFEGNRFFSKKFLTDVFYKKGSSLIKANYLDENYLTEFQDIIKKKYLENGFLFSEIVKPVIRFNEEKDEAEVNILIIERQQTTLNEIKIKGVDNKLFEDVLKSIHNKKGAALNVVALEKDLDKVINVIREKGYYFAEYRNRDPKKIVTYTSNYKEAALQLDIISGPKTVFESLLVTGNVKTKFQVVDREVLMKRGDIITPKKMQNIRNRLTLLGLFSAIRVTPYIGSSNEKNGETRVNLLVQLKEKDFGQAEVAPGYRTDLGAKFSGGVVLNNISGMNRSLSMQVQGNLRLSFKGLDERRKQEEKRLLEGLVKFSFNEPYVGYNLIKTKLDGEMSASFQRKRFSSFDADIFKLSPQLSKTFGDNVSTSLRYQLEVIRQFDATREINNDTFRIGSLTPSISWDLRDDPTNPKKGAYFALSWEFANSYFYSMEEDDLVINFNKLVSRNRFYVPVTDSLVIATSLAGGVEKNFATGFRKDADGNIEQDEDGNLVPIGYIPSLKVFRLEGVDQVRGFSSDEINRLESGVDIGDVIINDKAYFLNLKVEPRYYINDNVVVGGFFDAGSLYVNSLKPLKLRTAIGGTFKFVTQVGSLDFDYGIKLKRRENDAQQRESFGRFHLSIGFF